MKFYLLLALCYALCWSDQAHADIDNEVKRGVYPFLAILYYTDDTILDANGNRFQRGAVLIKVDWLLSSAIDHSMVDGVAMGFPTKTLLAKAGAITLDVNFTLNEDEEEQEREIIQLVRPNIHNLESWWLTDLTLLKTLLPFKETSAVAPKPIVAKQPFNERNCFILVFAKKFKNATEDKTLMQLTVDLLPPSIDNCGNQFSETTMTCGLDTGETKSTPHDPDFCQGNSGSPLVCDSDIIGVQTYINNNCKTPHLYQLLSSWDTFINCGIAEKCMESHCNVCQAVNKDKSAAEEGMDTSDVPDTTNVDTTTTTPVPDTIFRESEITTTTEEVPATQITSENADIPITSTEPSDSTESETDTVPDNSGDLTTPLKKTWANTKNTTVFEQTRPWPVERAKNDSIKTEQMEEVARKTNMEAQLQPQVKMVKRNAGQRGIICRIQNVVISLFGLACLF